MTLLNKFFSVILFLLLAGTTTAAELLPPGQRALPLGVHAFTNAKVVTKPGETFTNAIIIIRDGLIEKVGSDLSIPPEARVWDMKGMTIYAGFIDPYLSSASAGPAEVPAKKNLDLTAGKFFGVPGGERDPGNPGPGSELSSITPERRMAKTFAPDPKNLEKLREIGFTVGNIVPEKGIIRGSSALVALSDVDPNRAIIRADVFQHVQLEGEGRVEDVYPDSLMGVIAVVRQTFFDAQHYAAEHDAYEQHAEGKRPAFNPSAEALAPAIHKKMRVAFEPNSSLLVDRATRIAHEVGLDFCIVSSGEEWRRPDLAKAAAVPFIVPLDFPEMPKLPEKDDWTQISLDQLRAWDWAAENPAVLRQQNLEIALTTYNLEDKKNFRKNLRAAIDRGLSEEDALAALTTVPAKLCGVEKQLGTIEAGKFANFTIVSGNGYFDPEAKVKAVWIDGAFYRTDPDETKKEQKNQTAEEKKKEDTAKAEKEKKTATDRAAAKIRLAHSTLQSRGPITNPVTMLIHDATVWTCGPAGKLEHADITIADGKIKSITTNLVASTNLDTNIFTINAKGKDVTPGLIDCHNHSYILGDVNEGGLPSTAMVRIGDVINSESANIYEQLAGGLTAANVLHGSANPIGGQNCVIKLRDGETPEGMKLKGAPEGIKFALGENVKQSNWGDKYKTRFPQTRMGVQTFFANRFTAAQQYLTAWADFKAGKTTVAPARDLELEALGEILEGKRLIHCHSYRQDEILMLLRLMQSFGVKIATFQHVLEGYKIADELAQGGVGASTFADWWAYKFEVYDAIPYNGSLMRERGVTVSFNSDSADLARHLNFEAAKAVKFGGTTEEEALKFVTINPAKQLRIDKQVGSLEPGKDADFVVWSKDPLDSTSVCLETWIEGKKYFDRSLNTARVATLEKERKALIDKAQKLAKPDKESGKEDTAAQKKFFKVSLEHEHDFQIVHCEKEDN